MTSSVLIFYAYINGLDEKVTGNLEKYSKRQK